MKLLRTILCGLFKLETREHYEREVLRLDTSNAQKINFRNRTIEALEKQLRNQNDADYAPFTQLKEFIPVLAERGRRVLGNLKQSSPRTVQCDSELLTDAATILSPATPGGALGRASVVDTMLDLRCLNLALRGGDGIHWEVDDIFVCIKGVSVIVEGEIYKEEANDG